LFRLILLVSSILNFIKTKQNFCLSIRIFPYCFIILRYNTHPLFWFSCHHLKRKKLSLSRCIYIYDPLLFLSFPECSRLVECLMTIAPKLFKINNGSDSAQKRGMKMMARILRCEISRAQMKLFSSSIRSPLFICVLFVFFLRIYRRTT
jgi:hypothetical protein